MEYEHEGDGHITGAVGEFDTATEAKPTQTAEKVQLAKPAQQIKPNALNVFFSLFMRVGDFPVPDKTGKRKPRPPVKPSDEAAQVYSALEPLVPEMPAKYWNNLLELVSCIGIHPSLNSKDHAGYTRITRNRLRELHTPKWIQLIKEHALDSYTSEKHKGDIAYKLKQQAIQLLIDADIRSLEALRAVPEDSGTPNIAPMVTVNLPSIKLGLEVISCHLNGHGHKLLQDKIEAIDPDDRHQKLLAIHTTLTSIAAEAEAREGQILQTYAFNETQSRYYGEGANHIQQVPRLARAIIFNGCWDIDISCCHHSILLHLANENQQDLPYLSAYVANKAAIRNSVAQELAAPLPKVKEALIATINSIGQEKLESLLPNHNTSKTLTDLRKDIKLAVRPLGVKWDGVGAYLNQWERSAIEAATAMHTSSVASCHDGYITRTKEDIKVAEAAMLEATGMHLNLEIKQLLLKGFPIPESL